MFNTKTYAWSQVTLAINGRIITGVTGLRYEKSQEKEYVYGSGVNPQGIKKGNVNYTGELTLHPAEVQTLLAASPNGDLLALSCTVTVAYAGDDAVIRTDSLLGVQFTTIAKQLSQNDKAMTIPLPIMFLGLLQNV